ncbi:hypothetical protein ABIC74_003747 [Mucilaginibacter rubeus]
MPGVTVGMWTWKHGCRWIGDFEVKGDRRKVAIEKMPPLGSSRVATITRPLAAVA